MTPIPFFLIYIFLYTVYIYIFGCVFFLPALLEKMRLTTSSISTFSFSLSRKIFSLWYDDNNALLKKNKTTQKKTKTFSQKKKNHNFYRFGLFWLKTKKSNHSMRGQGVVKIHPPIKKKPSWNKMYEFLRNPKLRVWREGRGKGSQQDAKGITCFFRPLFKLLRLLRLQGNS